MLSLQTREGDILRVEGVTVSSLVESEDPFLPPGTRVVHSHWSSFYFTVLSLVQSFRVFLAPAILCHKEQAWASRAFEHKIPPSPFGCDELVLYGIRELAPATS